MIAVVKGIEAYGLFNDGDSGVVMSSATVAFAGTGNADLTAYLNFAHFERGLL
jgi:ABC-type thiamine transport system substrate-binding protein